ncbi:50S ribosomal protein L4 [Candidatus Nardonella dryophthoridicola]|uniref:Large ribosomal subunit protein uL4 n=1 Tax=endosymbiont of Rhynchophorus ferrugineus TaxID=1972133 RepID=A0A2Z5TIM1_9GAMM|nr:50S ribosomal protein L4 [Candidatus Nardonella dryophthoridicola]BBA85092.1 50S ribosomal protein L4 [endosymbiont of Rhynchophorus ferrugineus]
MELITENKKNIFLSDNVFKICYNNSLVNQVIITELSINRKNIKFNKNRSRVKGSNKKPWKQKGTGKARSGSKKSPIWRSGGVTFGSQVRNFKKKINKKMYCKALKCILSRFISNKKIIIMEDLNIENYKTKTLFKKFSSILKYKLLFIIENYDKNLFLSSKNIYNICIMNLNNIIISKIINYDFIIFTFNSIKKIEERLLKK